ncbi:hypothetical protein [Streptomyces sp. NPDC055287]
MTADIRVFATDRELDDVLRELLPDEYYELYTRLHQRHFHHWKWRRISEPFSLRGLRMLLVGSGVATLQRTRVHEIGRPFHEYAEEIGLPIEDFSESAVRAGRVSLLRAPERRFPQPGDCVRMYEQTTAGRTSHGLGESLTYSLDETLRNCMCEEARQDGPDYVKAFRCQLFGDALQQLEYWSVDGLSRSFSPRGRQTDDSHPEPYAPLLTKSGRVRDEVERRELTSLLSTVDALLGEQPWDPGADSGRVFATLLGLLVDDLLARLAEPNGMRFFYGYTASTLAALRGALPSLRNTITRWGFDADVLGQGVDDLHTTCVSFAHETAPEQNADAAWCERAIGVAEMLRALGLAMGRHQGDGPDVSRVFAVSNTIWRWVFFLEHRDRNVQTLDDPAGTRDEAADVVLRWLRRPLGVLDSTDIDSVFRDLVPDDDETIPKAFHVLMSMVASEPEQYLVGRFGVRDTTQAASVLHRFIGRRYVLQAIRRHVRRVLHDEVPESADVRTRVRTLADLFTTWAYDDGGDTRLRAIEDDPEEIVRALRSGQWCDELLESTAADALTARERATALAYLDDPQGFSARYFRFDEPGFRIEEWVGMMPPEWFTFWLWEPDEPADPTDLPGETS